MKMGIYYTEGEYLSEKLKGKRKKYYESGNLLFEDEYVNGKKNRKRKEF